MEFSLDEIAFTVFVGCFLCYFLLMFLSFRRSKPTKFKVFSMIYENWVESRLGEESPLVAVQALRNFIMGNSTFVSALFVLLGIILGFFGNFLNNTEDFFMTGFLSVGLAQVGLIIFLIGFSLFNFILSIRYATRLSLLITGKPLTFSMGPIKGSEITTDTLSHAQNHWSLGVRGLFYLITSLAWLINALFLLIFSIAITLYLLYDHGIFQKGR